jgi:hypothetical protein
MKPPGIALVVLGLATAALRAEVPTLDFVGVTYRLETVEVTKDGTVINEYVPDHGPRDSWTTFVTVSHWPKAKKIGDAAGPWMQSVQSYLMHKPGAYRPKTAKNENDVMFEVWVTAPERTFIKIHLHRFVMEPGFEGVKAYLYTQKITLKDGKGDSTSYSMNRSALLAEIGKAEFLLHAKKD